MRQLLLWMLDKLDGKGWTLPQAVALCTQLFEYNLAQFRCYPALTGGTLYKKGSRKDLDVLFYPDNTNRMHNRIDKQGLLTRLSNKGFVIGDDFGYCVKATWRGKDIDFFFVGYLWTEKAKPFKPSGADGYK